MSNSLYLADCDTGAGSNTDGFARWCQACDPPANVGPHMDECPPPDDGGGDYPDDGGGDNPPCNPIYYDC